PEARVLPRRLSISARAQHNPDLELAARAAHMLDSPASPPQQDARYKFVEALSDLLSAPSDSAARERARSSMRDWAGASSAPLADSQTGEIKQQSSTLPQRADSRREQALATIRRAQELLAQMPQQLGKAEQAAVWSRQTQRRVKQAQQDLAAAP